MTVEVGDTVKDESGRLGLVTEVRGDGFFARPAELPYRLENPEGIFIMSTFWSPRSNGKFAGMWADSPLNFWTYVEVTNNEK